MKNDKGPSDPGNTNYGGGYYGGYYYGEGYAGYGYTDTGSSPSRSFRDYFVIFRERIWWLLVIAFVVFMTAAIYTVNTPEKYTAVAALQVKREANRELDYNPVVSQVIRSNEDFQTEVDILESLEIVQRVAKRLKDQELKDFMAPYRGKDLLTGKEKSEIEVLQRGRKIIPERLSFVVKIAFTHHNPKIAAQVANYFAEEYIKYKMDLRYEGSHRAVNSLKRKVDEQSKAVQGLELELAEFKERYSSVSFDEHTNIDQQELIKLNEFRTLREQTLHEYETQRNLIQKVRDEGRPLWELDFVANSKLVEKLLDSYAVNRVQRATLAKKYGPKHPSMRQATEAMEETERELQSAVDTVLAGVENGYRRAKENLRKAEAEIEEKKQEIIELQKVRVEYNNLLRQYSINHDTHQQLHARYLETMAMSQMGAETANIIDRATTPWEPSSPNYLRNLGIGLFGGIALGFGVVFLLAMLDDKVKTAYDIETSIGLPLIGIVPRISRADSAGKARVVADNTDKHTVEAFRAVHSTLKLNDDSKKAKVILTTSTIPSEGKSFVTTNMAFTFASHGERTIVIDGDLRMPNVGKSLQLENKAGILQYMAGDCSLDEAIVHDVAPNTDVLLAGGRSKHPTQILSSEKFEALLHELRMRYDKVFIDSPPLAPVSDALNLLSLVDGVLYVIRFNMVKRRTAQINVRRLRESNVPVFGAILNNINSNVAGYYYSHYYDKAYRHYYVTGGTGKDVVDQPPKKEPAQAEESATRA